MPDYVDIHEEEIGEKPFEARLMLRLLAYLKPYTKWVIPTLKQFEAPSKLKTFLRLKISPARLYVTNFI